MTDKQPAPPGFPKLPWRVSDDETISNESGGYVALWPHNRRDIAEAIVTAVNAYYHNADEQESPE